VKELIVTQSAQFEIDQAIAWYDAIQPDLGDNLLYQIDIGLRHIAERPAAWSSFAEKYRHYIIERFPYAIIYEELPELIEVLAFAHHRRKPLYWSESD
jgi:toxin ParE1/3/4